MMNPTQHVPEPMLAALVAGTLPYPFAMVVATHVSLCDECRAHLEAHQIVGGLVLDDLEPIDLAPGARVRTVAALDSLPPTSPGRSGDADYPAPISNLVGSGGPRWRSLGFGARQAILWTAAAGSLRLLSIPAGRPVPEHSHGGLELTLVLAGAFTDETGAFHAGDVEVADETLDHTPRATDDGPCLCVAATDAPLHFRAMLPRLLQPLFRI